MPWAGPATITEPTTLPLPTIKAPFRSSPPATKPKPTALPAALSGGAGVPVSATLAANEELAARRRRGEPVLPLAFGEAGLPVHPRLAAELAEATGLGAYGPVAGSQRLRAGAAGYWSRRALPTEPAAVVAGPGSKALLFGVLLALGVDVAVPRPSWVSYAAQATLCGVVPHFVPSVAGEGGICDGAALDAAVRASRTAGRPIGAVLVTMPDNPTGRLASPAAVRDLCAAAERHNLVIISDEIYRDLIHDPATPFLSPAVVAPHRTVVTTALSKSLAVGGWRIGVARMPDGAARRCPAPTAAGNRERDLVRARCSCSAGGGARSRRTSRRDRAGLPEPVAARGRLSGRGPDVRRRRTRHRAAPGGLLPVPGL